MSHSSHITEAMEAREDITLGFDPLAGGQQLAVLPRPGATAAAAGKTVDLELVARLKSLVDNGFKGRTFSRGALARALGTNTANVSLYLRQDLPTPPPFSFAVATLEAKITDFLHTLTSKRDFDMGIIETHIISDFRKFVRGVRETNETGFYYGPAGLGKSTAIEDYAAKNANAIPITATKWQANVHGITHLIYTALKSPALARGQHRGAAIATILKEREAVLIIDNAHRLTINAIEFLFDLQDATETPMVFVGNKRFLARLKPDDQLHSRIFLKREAAFPVQETGTDRNRELHAAADALLKRELPGHVAELRVMARKVARESGHFRALVKRLRLALSLSTLPAYQTRPMTDAFKAAHALSVNDGYNLED